MQGFGFQTLALLTAVGLAGPLLASLPGLRIPVIIGELIAGLVIGRTGFGLVDDANPTFQLFANIGFALVMFVVGTHVPVRDPEMRSAVPRALARAVLVGAVAAALGVGVAAAFGTGHAALYAVLMSSSSAALALPVDRFAAVTGTASAVGDCADRYCRRREYRVAAVGNRPPAGADGGTGWAGDRGRRGGVFCAAARDRPQGLASARTRLLQETCFRAGIADQPAGAVRSGGAGRAAPTCRSCWRASRWVW